MNMKDFFLATLLAVAMSTTMAFVPQKRFAQSSTSALSVLSNTDSSISTDRRAAMKDMFAAFTVIAAASSVPQLALAEVSDDTSSSVAAIAARSAAANEAARVKAEQEKAKKEKDAGSGGILVGTALGGGLLLSLPFFLPNLLRLAGFNNAKLKK
uniref:Uncharacterized protein n=1 Tax=Leptocylindrus danicus TaxID=163516 RepID=A0A7S2K6V0_9STRA|mmetsp:Transcript_1887/g.2784  ORF Transcript_1887/g.2784 Transcript_1887/m.2784 type:complete len:155 (+) Transcript_1887:43-507(+)